MSTRNELFKSNSSRIDHFRRLTYHQFSFLNLLKYFKPLMGLSDRALLMLDQMRKLENFDIDMSALTSSTSSAHAGEGDIKRTRKCWLYTRMMVQAEIDLLRGLAKAVGYEGALTRMRDVRVVILVVDMSDKDVEDDGDEKSKCAFFHYIEGGGMLTPILRHALTKMRIMPAF